VTLVFFFPILLVEVGRLSSYLCANNPVSNVLTGTLSNVMLICGSRSSCINSIHAQIGPAAEGCVQNLATAVCSTSVVDRGEWSLQYLSRALALVRWPFNVRQYYRSAVQNAGKSFRDGAFLLFE
jgi:hypothetical protein